MPSIGKNLIFLPKTLPLKGFFSQLSLLSLLFQKMHLDFQIKVGYLRFCKVQYIIQQHKSATQPKLHILSNAWLKIKINY